MSVASVSFLHDPSLSKFALGRQRAALVRLTFTGTYGASGVNNTLKAVFKNLLGVDSILAFAVSDVQYTAVLSGGQNAWEYDGPTERLRGFVKAGTTAGAEHGAGTDVSSLVVDGLVEYE